MDTLNSNNVPEILLLVMGVVALAIVIGYREDKDSALYKVLVLIGVLTGAFLVYVAMAVDTGWSKGTLIVLTVAAFTLIVRPIKDVNIAAVIGLIVEGTNARVGALTGKLGNISGITVKSALTAKKVTSAERT